MARKRVRGRFANEGAATETDGSEMEGPEGDRGTTEEGGGAAFPGPGAVAERVAAPRPRHCRSFTRKRIAEQMPSLVEMLLKQAHGGSLGHLKVLVQLAGLDKGEVTPAVKRKEKSLEAILMEQWEKDAARAAEEEAQPTEAMEGEPWGKGGLPL